MYAGAAVTAAGLITGLTLMITDIQAAARGQFLGHSLTSPQARPLVITVWIVFGLVAIALAVDGAGERPGPELGVHLVHGAVRPNDAAAAAAPPTATGQLCRARRDGAVLRRRRPVRRWLAGRRCYGVAALALSLQDVLRAAPPGPASGGFLTATRQTRWALGGEADDRGAVPLRARQLALEAGKLLVHVKAGAGGGRREPGGLLPGRLDGQPGGLLPGRLDRRTGAALLTLLQAISRPTPIRYAMCTSEEITKKTITTATATASTLSQRTGDRLLSPGPTRTGDAFPSELTSSRHWPILHLLTHRPGGLVASSSPVWASSKALAAVLDTPCAAVSAQCTPPVLREQVICASLAPRW
jgi:hypothetical protein